MSGDEEKPEKKHRASERDKVQVEPDPKDRSLFEWLESLFYAEPEVAHFPEKLDVRLVSGPRYDKMGPYLHKIDFAPMSANEEALKKMPGKMRKPTREQLVALSNTFVLKMQKDCDESKRQQWYGVHAWHMSVEAEPYTRFIKHCKPQGRYSKTDHQEDDDSSLEQRFGVQVLTHGERMFALYGGAFEGMLDRFDRLIERSYDRIEKQDAVIQRQNDMLERALNMEAERKQRLEWERIKVKGVEKGLDFALQMAPPMINQLAGKTIIPTADTAETITLRNFLKTTDEGGALTKEQADVAFGTYEDAPPHKLLTEGILTQTQGEILVRVARAEVPPDELDKLMPGAEHGLTMEQAGRLQQIFPMEQIAPLMLIFESRRKKQAS